MKAIKYIGCFFEPAQLQEKLTGYERTPLFRTISAPHITFAYRPEAVDTALFGIPVTVEAVGYGNDGENEALQVVFRELPGELKNLADHIAVPHITLSVSEQGQSVNSRYLPFLPIAPFTLTGVFGAMDEAGNIYT